MQNALGELIFRNAFFSDIYNNAVLELGRGLGTWIHTLSDYVSYLGLYWNIHHINDANQKYNSEKIVLKADDAAHEIDTNQRHFDYIFGFGILNLLNDEQASKMLDAYFPFLFSKGRLSTIDPVYHEKQHFIAEWMADHDSGQNDRSRGGYEKLAKSTFKNDQTYITTNKLMRPYSHCVMVAT